MLIFLHLGKNIYLLNLKKKYNKKLRYIAEIERKLKIKLEI